MKSKYGLPDTNLDGLNPNAYLPKMNTDKPKMNSDKRKMNPDKSKMNSDKTKLNSDETNLYSDKPKMNSVLPYPNTDSANPHSFPTFSRAGKYVYKIKKYRQSPIKSG